MKWWGRGGDSEGRLAPRHPAVEAEAVQQLRGVANGERNKEEKGGEEKGVKGRQKGM